MQADEEYFASEEFQEILEQYETSVKSGHSPYMDVDDLADIADYYHMNERFAEADDAIQLALSLYPGATSPLVYKIHEALNVGDVKAAIGYQEQIEDQSDIEFLFISAEILIAQDKIDEADEMFRKYFREIAPDEHQDYVIDVANIYSDYNVHDKAMEWMSRAMPEDNDDFKELTARTMFGLGKYKESERIFNELIDHNPFSKYYWNALASAQFMNEDYSASVTSSEYAIAIDPEDAESLLSKANGLYRLENYEEALKFFERYTEKVPYDEFGLLHQGTCLINISQYDKAIDILEEALKFSHPQSQYLPEIYQELAFAYSELKKPDTALYYLDKTEDLECDHLDILVIKGHILLSNGRQEEAEKMFQKAIVESGNAPKTMMRILVSIYDNKYVHAAYTMFKKLFTIVSDDWTEGYAYMALCCWDLQQYDEFLHYLKIATERNPKEARMVLNSIFPEGMAPEEYYPFMKEKYRL